MTAKEEYLADITEVKNRLVNTGFYNENELKVIENIHKAASDYLNNQISAGDAMGALDHAISEFEDTIMIHRSPTSKRSDLSLYYRIAETIEDEAKDEYEEEYER